LLDIFQNTSYAVNKYREHRAVFATLSVLRQQPHSANSVY